LKQSGNGQEQRYIRVVHLFSGRPSGLEHLCVFTAVIQLNVDEKNRYCDQYFNSHNERSYLKSDMTVPEIHLVLVLIKAMGHDLPKSE
jgi:hypothetical protein